MTSLESNGQNGKSESSSINRPGNSAYPWYSGITRWGPLRTKFLLSLLLVSAFLTCSTLLVVRHRVQLQAREQMREGLLNSVVTFRVFQLLRDPFWARSAALMADLPSLEALMTSEDPRTIQDGAAFFWNTVRGHPGDPDPTGGSDLFVLAGRTGKLMALYTTLHPALAPAEAGDLLQRSLRKGETRDWWFGNGHLFQVFMQPIYAGETQYGVLVLGYEINGQVADDVSQVASSQVAFRYGSTVVVSTLPAAERQELQKQSALLQPIGAGASLTDIDLGGERFLAASTGLVPGSAIPVSLVVLKSYGEATRVLESLNRWLLGLGLTAILAGSLLVYLISDTFTRPLANLVGGVHALERGDYGYPLEAYGNDEVSELTESFDRMRRSLQSTQQELLQAERLATIGRMASTVSHDLRHSLSAILAYAEFLSEGSLGESRRVEFYQEIRQAVSQMTEQLRALLEFSKAKAIYRPVFASLADVIKRAVHTVKARPEFAGIRVVTSFDAGSEAWFDPGSLERVFHNLLLNACEAVPADSGLIEVSSRATAGGIEIRIADNGSGIPAEIREKVFQPFVTSGKDNGIGLGLAVVQKIIQDHGGQVAIERTGITGTVLRVCLPAKALDGQVARQGVA
jgi:signal transduction histidine kinase